MSPTLIACGALLVLVAIIIAVAIRTLQFRSTQRSVAPLPAIDLPESAIVDRLSAALRIPTVSYDDPSQIEHEAFQRFHRFIEVEFPVLSRTLQRTIIHDRSLLFEWTGSDATLKPIILTAHLDVVPVERDRWTSDPFDGRVEDGFVWGRGALDDKGSLVSILEAVELLASRGFVPRRTLYLGFGHDEERGCPAGLEGAKQIALFLRERGVRAELAIDEGLSILRGAASPVKGKDVALIGVSQKGYVSIRLSASAPGGHAMAPPVDHTTVSEQLARAILTLMEHPFELRIDPVIDRLFDYIGPEVGLAERVLFANRWLFRRVLMMVLARKASSAALLHTTMAATVLKAGTKEQSLPEDGYALINFRTMPGQSSSELLASVRETLKGQPVSVELNGPVHESTPRSSTSSRGFACIDTTVREIFSGTIVAPGLAPGRSDAEYYVGVADDVYLFAPYIYSPELLETVHGHDERISVENYLAMVRFYVRLVENLCGSEDEAHPARSAQQPDRRSRQT